MVNTIGFVAVVINTISSKRFSQGNEYQLIDEFQSSRLERGHSFTINLLNNYIHTMMAWQLGARIIQFSRGYFVKKKNWFLFPFTGLGQV